MKKIPFLMLAFVACAFVKAECPYNKENCDGCPHKETCDTYQQKETKTTKQAKPTETPQTAQ